MMCTYMSRELIKISSLVKPAPLFHWWWWTPNTVRVHLSSLSTHYHHLALPCPYTPRYIEAVFVEKGKVICGYHKFLYLVFTKQANGFWVVGWLRKKKGSVNFVKEKQFPIWTQVANKNKPQSVLLLILLIENTIFPPRAAIMCLSKERERK